MNLFVVNMLLFLFIRILIFIEEGVCLEIVK